MKLTCGVYEDLLLLYNDGLCNEDTKKLVEEHLAGCERCSRYLKNMRLPEEIVKEEAVKEGPAENARAEKESIKKGFRKIKRRWIMSLLVLPLLLVLAVPGMMIANEVRGEGVCFSNLDDIWYCRKFFKLIADGEYEKAAGMLDFSREYRDVREFLLGEMPDAVMTEEKREIFLEFYGDVLNMTQEEFVEQEQQKIANYLLENQEAFLLSSFRLDEAYRTGYSWEIGYEIVERVKNPDKVGAEYISYGLSFVKNDEGLVCSSSSMPIRGFFDLNDEGKLLYDSWGNPVRLWEPEEELVLFGAFHMQGNHLSRRMNGLE